jgi:hypothetical protein
VVKQKQRLIAVDKGLYLEVFGAAKRRVLFKLPEQCKHRVIPLCWGAEGIFFAEILPIVADQYPFCTNNMLIRPVKNRNLALWK